MEESLGPSGGIQTILNAGALESIGMSVGGLSKQNYTLLSLVPRQPQT